MKGGPLSLTRALLLPVWVSAPEVTTLTPLSLNRPVPLTPGVPRIMPLWAPLARPGSCVNLTLQLCVLTAHIKGLISPNMQN